MANIFMQLKPLDEVLSVRFVPFAIYVHDKDLANPELFWDKCTPHVQKFLLEVHDSKAGDYYQSVTGRKNAILVQKERSIIVFGKYGEPELHELIQMRDYLMAKGYDSRLLSDLPEHPAMSIEEKVKLWSSASRFCVMIDRVPSGHLVEYPYLKDTRVVLVLLRPEDRGSTTMIEDNPIDFPFIKTFKFRSSPLEAIDAGIVWAEGYLRRRAEVK